MQQALEKHVKAVAAYWLNDEDPAQLRHLTYAGLLTRSGKYVEELDHDVDADRLKKVCGFFAALDEHRAILWKSSLGIELNEREERKWRTFKSEHRHNSKLYASIRKQLKAASRVSADDLESKNRQLGKQITHCNNPGHKKCKCVQFVFEYVLNLGIHILHLVPHESIGRYPITLDGRSTFVLYGENKTMLEEMLDKTQRMCDDLGGFLELDNPKDPNRT